MRRIRLIHWNAAEAAERAERLRAAGYLVVHKVPFGLDFLRELKATPPSAVVIDLVRLPLQGRDVGMAIRHAASTRGLPLVFVDGDPEKVARVRQSLPDAVYTTWGRIRGALREAIAHPPKAPVAPRSLFDVYAGLPLARKLGIKPNSVVATVDAPAGFRKTLGTLPNGVFLRDRLVAGTELALWFVRSGRDLQRGIGIMAARLGSASLWIAWPKKASGIDSDLTQQEVRRSGLAAGLVDYKISAIDATWSGLLFTRRKTKKP